MAVKLLTNIDNIYYTFIENESKNKKITKRSVIERALEVYIQEMKKNKLNSEYEIMGQDKEYLQEMIDNSNYLSYL